MVIAHPILKELVELKDLFPEYILTKTPKEIILPFKYGISLKIKFLKIKAEKDRPDNSHFPDLNK